METKNLKTIFIGTLTIVVTFLGSLCVQEISKSYYESRNLKQITTVLKNIESIDSSKPLEKELSFFINNKRVIATKKYKTRQKTTNIVEYYKSQLSKNNWTLEKEESTISAINQKNSSYTYFFSKEKCVLQLIVYVDENKDINYAIYVFSPL